MSYNPATDFIGLWRSSGGNVAKGEMPGLDFVIAALNRAGVLNVSVSGSAPVANQSTTAWLQPASPSYSAEGGFQLWNAVGATYQTATMRLLLEMLAAAEKVAAVPTAISSLLDTLSATRGSLAYRGATGWAALAPGTVGLLLTSGGAGADPVWSSIGSASGALDGITSTVGAVLYRGTGGAGWLGTAGGAVNTLLVNTATNIPAWETLSQYIDAVMGSTQNQILYRTAGAWSAQTLSQYIDAVMGSTQNQILVRGASLWSASTLSALLDNVVSNAQGTLVYRNNASWVALAPGTVGQLLQTGGAAANPSWITNWPASTQLYNAIGGDVALNNTGLFFDGPSVAQGTVGTFLAMGKVTITDASGGFAFTAKLWDGTTVMDTVNESSAAAAFAAALPLVGIITNPANNIKISAKSPGSTTSLMRSSASGFGKDSSLTVIRLA